MGALFGETVADPLTRSKIADLLNALGQWTPTGRLCGRDSRDPGLHARHDRGEVPPARRGSRTGAAPVSGNQLFDEPDAVGQLFRG